VDWPDARKRHRLPVPRTGGIAIFVGYAAAVAMRGDWTILPAVVAAFGTGLLDDLVGLKPRTKIAGQMIAALLACAAGVRIGGGSAWWHVAITIIWLVGCTNAINLIDGLDGLAAGVGIFAAAAALGTGNAALALWSAPLVGALLGFLPYNFSASIFMGDCGSNTVGFLLGCLTVRWSQNSGSLAGMSAPVIAMAIPIVDTALAILRRFVRNEPIFAADRGHIHHRLLERGFSPRRVVCVLYGGAGFFACLSVGLTRGTYSRAPLLAAFCVAVWLALRYLRYEEFDCLGRVFFGGVLRRALSSDLAVRQLEAAIVRAQTIEECWCAVEDSGRGLGLSGAKMQVYGRTFSAKFRETETSNDGWSLRILLSGADAIELDGACAFVPPLSDALRRVLVPKLESLRPPMAFAAAAGGNAFRRTR
jgi:UDP-GlcNAc:undecaprenyl-phosphate GlcNAc-1-phosphate transferase